MIFKCFDLETTSIDTESAEVVQAAIVETSGTSGSVDLSSAQTHSTLFRVSVPVPVEATRVHRVTDANPERFDFGVRVIPDDAPSFAACVRSMVDALTADDVVSVSYNGCGYDIPIIVRYMSLVFGSDFVTEAERDAAGVSASAVAFNLRRRHIDVMRLWLRVRATSRVAPWCDPGVHAYMSYAAVLTADMFAGSLTAAHGYWLGEGFGDAHDAGVDCMATLRVLDAMLAAGVCDVETAIKWSNQPLPGDVDFAGKFAWRGDQVVIKFGKHASTPLEDIPTSYIRWMLGSDFPGETKAMLLRFTQGEYPERMYEDE